MKIHALCCGYIRVSETVPFGNAISLKNAARQLAEPDRSRVTLPVFAYLIEHPRGPLLVDGGRAARRTRTAPGGAQLRDIDPS